MDELGSTCWTVVKGAAAGREEDREEFARRYVPVVRAYLGARWRNSPLRSEIDDATQEVFLACFRDGGALERVDADRGGFRAYFYGVVRNVARRIETGRVRRRAKEASLAPDPDHIEADQDGLSTVFDRAWAKSIVREAAAIQQRRAEAQDEHARRRVELLRLRFQEGMPIREIARAWDMDPEVLHREYPKARAEFAAALTEAVAFHHPGPRREIERECARLLAALA